MIAKQQALDMPFGYKFDRARPGDVRIIDNICKEAHKIDLIYDNGRFNVYRICQWPPYKLPFMLLFLCYIAEDNDTESRIMVKGYVKCLNPQDTYALEAAGKKILNDAIISQWGIKLKKLQK